MVFKKNCSRIISIILAICALSALCAVGASAVDEPSITPSNHMSRADQYALYGWSVDPDYFIYEDDTVIATYSYGSRIKSIDGPAICFCTAQNNLNPTSYPCPWLFVPQSNRYSSSSVAYNGSASSPFNRNVNNILFWVYAYGGSNGATLTSTDYPTVTYQWSSIDSLLQTELENAGFSMDEPEPEPEPSQDGWLYPSSELYFTNISDSSFAFNNLNYPFQSFPSKDIIIDDSPSKIIVGSFFENTDWLSSGSTVSGQLQIQFTSPLISVDNFVQRGFIWLVNGSDPSLSGFQYYEIPSSWEYIFTVWKYPVNQWTNEYIFNFEFTFSEDLSQTIGFTPVNILFGLYGILPAGSFSTECWYNVQNLVFGYYIPPSSGDSQVPSTPVFNNPDSTSTVINPSQPTVTDNLNTELGFYDNVWKSYNITSDTFIDFFEEVIGFGATDLDQALGRLYNAFSYTGSGSIYLPSATIPFGDSELHLWDQTEIPFYYWFSNLPSQIKVVFGFIIVFSAASASWGIAFFFIRKIVSGNYQTSDF